MSILIKGMEMPKDCLKCPFCLFADGYWKCLVDGSHADFGGTCRPSLCPLVPVTGHGRLIDADEFLKRSIGTKCFRGDYALMLEELVGESVTIIPAGEMI